MGTTTNTDLKIRVSVDKGNTKSSINDISNGFLKATAIIKGVELGLRALEFGFKSVANFISGAVTTAKDFQTSMLNVKALTGTVGDEFETLSELALDLGSNTEFTAVQVADAMGFMAMAGLETNEILAATPSILNLASASGLDFASSADIATNIMAQFSIEAKNTDRVVDVLAKTVTSSNTDMIQFADAMNFLGPTAASMGISLEQASAIIGIMANNGLKGSLGTRALGTSLTRLAAPTARMEEAMNDLNIEFFDLDGNMNSIDIIVDDLKKAFEGMTQEQQNAALSALFGAEAFQEWNILIKEGGDGIRGFTDDLIDSGGAAEEMADIKLSGLEGALLTVTSAWEGFQIRLVDAVDGLGVTQQAAEFIAGAIGDLEFQVTNADSSFRIWLAEMQERFGPQIDEIKGKLNELIGRLRAIWETHGPQVKDAFKEIAEKGLEEAFNAAVILIDKLDEFIKWIEDNPEKINEMIQRFEDFGTAIGDIFGFVTDLISKIDELIEVGSKIKGVADAIRGLTGIPDFSASTGGEGGFFIGGQEVSAEEFQKANLSEGEAIVGELNLNEPSSIAPTGLAASSVQGSKEIVNAIKGLGNSSTVNNNFGSVSFGGDRGKGQEMNMFSNLLMNAAA